MIGQDKSVTIDAIQNGTFNPAGGKSIVNGSASGKITVAANTDIYNYLVIVETARYYTSPVQINRAGQTATFVSPAEWYAVPEPSTVMFLVAGVLVVLTRRKHGKAC
jgi:hypothetical protein